MLVTLLRGGGGRRVPPAAAAGSCFGAARRWVATDGVHDAPDVSDSSQPRSLLLSIARDAAALQARQSSCPSSRSLSARD